MSLYSAFVKKFSHVRLLVQVERLLKWDYEVCMPNHGVNMRAQQLVYISELIHQTITNPGYQHDLAQMIDIDTGQVKITDLTSLEEANLKAWAKDLLRALKLPPSFVQTFDHAKILAVKAWKAAKKAADFSLFAPYLQQMVDLNQKQAKYIGYTNTPYDALVDFYEPGMDTKTLYSIFTELTPFVSDLLKKKGNQSSSYQHFFDHAFDQESQMKFARMMLDAINVDSSRVRLDLSTHPFCTGIHPDDVRMTTRLEGGLLSHIFAVLHEAGHALYELGFDQAKWATPSAQPISLGVHESQSRWWEVMVGHSFSFWVHMYPQLQAAFPVLAGLSLTAFYQHINHVQPSLIRVYADELTYPLHIIFRFKIEKQLIEGTVSAADVPKLWNNAMEEFLGIVPNNHAVGCLQDIHWARGAFGYFPTYLLGNIYAVQYFDAFSKAFPDWKKKISSGSFSFMNRWLSENIHQFGRMYDAEGMMKYVTGSFVSTQPYKNYLSEKYG